MRCRRGLLRVAALAVGVCFAFGAINRQAVVARHNVSVIVASGNDLDRHDALTIGNGAFAINVDATGLQSMNGTLNAFDLNTLSDWAFHSIPAMDGGATTCQENIQEGYSAEISCSPSLITNITFMAFGTPTGSCSSGFADGVCNSGNATAIAAAACIGRESCSIFSGTATFGDPCVGTRKHIDISVACSGPVTPQPRQANKALLEYNYTWFNSSISAHETVLRPFATDNNISGPFAAWPMSNPSRVGLGQLSLRMLPASAPPGYDPSPLPPAALVNVSAALDTWAGGVSSTYTLVDDSGAAFRMAVATAVHPDADLVATRVTCAAADGSTPCPAALRLAFGYPDGAWGPTTSNYDPSFDELHTSYVLANDTAGGSLSVARMIDDSSYEVHCQWDDPAWTAVRTGAHRFVWRPPPGAVSAAVSLSCLFVPVDLVYPIGMASSAYVQARVATARALLTGGGRFPLQPSVQAAAAAMWGAFWAGGAFVDLASGTADPNAWELERRVVLSRFLTRSNSAGACPPQETGLLSNSWSGKFHLEMRFWHQAHWPLWGNPELLDRSNAFYFDLLPNATSLARFQGYKGARWLKMLGLANTHLPFTSIDVGWLGTDYASPPAWAPPGNLLLWESFNKINPVLQWNQPHMVWLADVQYRAVNASQGPAAAAAVIAELSPLVFATADYLASAPFFNETSGFFELGPPLLGGEEFGDFNVICRTTFETVYFAYALDVANEWRVRAGLPVEPHWANVSALLGNLPLDPAEATPAYSFNAEAACCYVPPARCPPGRFGGLTQCSPQSGHPMPAGVLGMVNGRYRGDKYGVNVAAANATIAAITNGWAPGWGWDYPLVALAMARMTWSPEAVVEYLLASGAQNNYIKTGYNYNGNFAYLPGNGGTLLTVAMMAAGTDTSPAMAFPAAWGAVAEGFDVPYP